MADERLAAGWRALLQSLEPLDRGVLIAVAQGLPPLGRNSIELIGKIPGARPSISLVRASVDQLRLSGVLAKSGSTDIEGQLFWK